MSDTARIEHLAAHPNSVRFDFIKKKWIAIPPGLRTGPGKFDFDDSVTPPPQAFDDPRHAIDCARGIHKSTT